MSYQLEYNLQSVKIIKNPIRRNRARFFVLLMVLVIGSITAHVLGTMFQNVILAPGEATQVAANEMAESLRSGVPLEDAIETFYTAIME